MLELTPMKHGFMISKRLLVTDKVSTSTVSLSLSKISSDRRTEPYGSYWNESF